jgi:hypothetical protein
MLGMAEGDKRIVYILRSDAGPSRHYVVVVPFEPCTHVAYVPQTMDA